MDLGGLTCQQCQSHIAQYHGHLLVDSTPEQAETMDATLADSMKAHLANCQSCRERFQAKYPDLQARKFDQHTIDWTSLLFAQQEITSIPLH
jgi:hypothetical protein